MSNLKTYLTLIRINLMISTFTFGGGYVVVPMIRKYYVDRYFSEKELMEMAAIAQSSPGAIAINLLVLAGRKAAGFPGFLIALVCGILPSLVILGIISRFYAAFIANHQVNAVLAGMQAAVAALIVDVVIGMIQAIRAERSLLLLAFVPLSFIANALFQINVVVILLTCCGICIFVAWKEERG